MSISTKLSSLNSELILAVRESDCLRLNTLIESGVTIDEVDQNGRTAFLHASITGDFDVAKLLLKAGANINAIDNEGRTATHLTVLGRSKKRSKRFLSQLLIKKSADLNVPDIHGFTPLMLCAKSRYYKLMKNGSPELASMLIDAGVDVNFINTDDWSALKYAVADGNKVMCELLIQSGAWPLNRSDEDFNIMMDLANPTFKSCLKSMLEQSIIIQEVGSNKVVSSVNSVTKKVIKRGL